jgi:hypothetical protein
MTGTFYNGLETVNAYLQIFRAECCTDILISFVSHFRLVCANPNPGKCNDACGLVLFVAVIMKSLLTIPVELMG